MTRDEACEQIQDACRVIAQQMMKVHPVIPKLGDEATQGDLIKASHELTVALETIKKKLIRLQQRDDSSEL